MEGERVSSTFVRNTKDKRTFHIVQSVRVDFLFPSFNHLFAREIWHRPRSPEEAEERIFQRICHPHLLPQHSLGDFLMSKVLL